MSYDLCCPECGHQGKEIADDDWTITLKCNNCDHTWEYYLEAETLTEEDFR